MRDHAPFWIRPGDHSVTFPDAQLALREPDGLLAIGGDLAPERLLAAYRHGIFPWYSHDQPILWWSPDPRMVLFPDRFRRSKSLRKILRQGRFRVTLDRAFDAVIKACAAPRPGSSGTWITSEMSQAYSRLHRLGFAHSVEVWQDQQLVGGLYGIALGRVFFGESMFSLVSNASKVAMAHLLRQLAAWEFELVDCQVFSAHLARLGAEPVARSRFIDYLNQYCDCGTQIGPWEFDPSTGNRDW